MRILAACLLILGMSSPSAAEELSDRMKSLLPAPLSGWSSTGARVKTVAKGPSKGTTVFQVYQNKARTVIVRFTENPPELIRKILADPGTYEYRATSFADHKAVIKDKDGSGTLMIPLSRFLLSVDWSGIATRDDAFGYARRIDIGKLEGLN